MFYVAYFKDGSAGAVRPITFLYNGGPGSSTVWLHMGAFGPKRVVTPGDPHLPPAPYTLVDNPPACSTPATWSSSTRPARASAASPGPTRRRRSTASTPTPMPSPSSSPSSSASTADGTRRSTCSARATARPARRCSSMNLESQRAVDFNGVILLSQILNFGLTPDKPTAIPGQIALRAGAARPTPRPPGTTTSLGADASGPAGAPRRGRALRDDRVRARARSRATRFGRRQSARRSPRSSTTIPACRSTTSSRRACASRRRIRETLQDAGPDHRPARLALRRARHGPAEKEPDYDPSPRRRLGLRQAFNDYVRRELQFGDDRTFKPSIDLSGLDASSTRAREIQPSSGRAQCHPRSSQCDEAQSESQGAAACRLFRFRDTVFRRRYEMRHLPMPAALQGNIEYRFYDRDTFTPRTRRSRICTIPLPASSAAPVTPPTFRLG